VAVAHLSKFLRNAKRYAEQEQALAEVIRISEKHPGYMTAEEFAHYRATLALSVKEQGRLTDAKPLLIASLAELRALGVPEKDRSVRGCLLALADVAQAEGDADEAARLRFAAKADAPASRPATAATAPATELSSRQR